MSVTVLSKHQALGVYGTTTYCFPPLRLLPSMLRRAPLFGDHVIGSPYFLDIPLFKPSPWHTRYLRLVNVRKCKAGWDCFLKTGDSSTFHTNIRGIGKNHYGNVYLRHLRIYGLDCSWVQGHFQQMWLLNKPWRGKYQKLSFFHSLWDTFDDTQQK